MRWRGWFLAALLLVPSSGWTALIEHYDLASLVHMSTYVVLVERGEKRALDKWHAATKCRVKKVYEGAMAPGQEIEVLNAPNDTYGKRPREFLIFPGAPEGGFSWDRETVLFLAEVADKSLLPAGAPPLTAIAIRTISEGKVYRFVQIENPGGEGPVPQGRDPEDLWLSYNVKPVDYATFEQDLRTALARAGRFESLRAAPRGPARTEALLELLGPAKLPSAVDFAAMDGLGPADAIAREIYNGFVEDRAVEAALDAFSRCRKRLGSWSRREMPSPAARLAIACDSTQPLVRRMAALWVFKDDIWHRDSLQLKPLLEDSAPEIRMAAASLFGESLRRRRSNPQLMKQEDFVACLEALAACWNREKDRGVRVAILRAIAGVESAERYFNSLKFTKQRVPIDPAYVLAAVETLAPGRLYEVRIIFGPVADSRLRFRDWTLIVARKGGEEIRRQALGDEGLHMAAFSAADREAIERQADAKRRQAIAALFARTHASWGRSWDTGLAETGARFPALLVPPLPPGTYELSVEVTVESGEPVVLRSATTIVSVEGAALPE